MSRISASDKELSLLVLSNNIQQLRRLGLDMKKKKNELSEPDSFPNEEPRIGSPDKGILISPKHPNRIGFVCQRAEPRVNEQGALEACAAVVAVLNSVGYSFDPPVAKPGREVGIDCISVSPAGTLNFQVTRALQDPEFWKYLGKNKGVMAYREMGEVADDLWVSISKKAQRIPVLDRAAIHLVLDASDLFAHHGSDTAFDFITRHGASAIALGFATIWVSGGHSMFVRKLA